MFSLWLVRVSAGGGCAGCIRALWLLEWREMGFGEEEAEAWALMKERVGFARDKTAYLGCLILAGM